MIQLKKYGSTTSEGHLYTEISAKPFDLDVPGQKPKKQKLSEHPEKPLVLNKVIEQARCINNACLRPK